MTLEVEDLRPRIGTAIRADKRVLLSGDFATQIRDLLDKRGVLVFPEIQFSDEEQVEFTKTLGRFAPEPNDPNSREDQVFKVSLDKSQGGSAAYLRGSMYWHLDGTMNEVPILASILTAKVLADEGGQTEFCNTYAAFEDLSDKEKEQYESLRVMHAAWASLFYYDPEPQSAMMDAMMAIGDNELPLVWKHSSGRKSLVLGCTAYEVIGMSAKESTRLLVKLREWATRPDLVYRHEWSVGDMVIWDNTGTMHRALAYDPNCGRTMHRTKLQGEEPFA